MRRSEAGARAGRQRHDPPTPDGLREGPRDRARTTRCVGTHDPPVAQELRALHGPLGRAPAPGRVGPLQAHEPRHDGAGLRRQRHGAPRAHGRRRHARGGEGAPRGRQRQRLRVRTHGRRDRAERRGDPRTRRGGRERSRSTGTARRYPEKTMSASGRLRGANACFDRRRPGAATKSARISISAPEHRPMRTGAQGSAAGAPTSW